MILELAGGDPDRAERFYRLPLTVLLDHYRILARTAAEEDYRQALLRHAVVAPLYRRGSRPKPPALPDILKGRP